MMNNTPTSFSAGQRCAQAQTMLDQAECLYRQSEVIHAIERLAEQIKSDYANKCPLVLGVMRGAFYFVGQLLPRLDFPLEVDFVSLSRYRDDNTGGQLTWQFKGSTAIAGRDVLVLDDILDEGISLYHIRQYVQAEHARSCRVAVLADKTLHAQQSKASTAEYIGLRLPDRFVFGCGMDASGLWRNLPEIYALRD